MIAPSPFTQTLAEATAQERRREAARRRAIDGMQHELDRLVVRHRARHAWLAAVASVLGL